MATETFSVIIPCLNEENYIGKLLAHLAHQSDPYFELIVVDGGSTDKTIEVIHKYQRMLPQMKVIQSDKKGVSYQRNLGAKQAASQHLLFLDADSRLDTDYIKDFKDEVEKSKAMIATAYIWPDSKNPLDWFFWLGGNMATDLSKYVWPVGYGMNLYVNKRLFEKIGGFSEQIKVAEDVDLVKRAVASGGKYAVLKKPKYYTDVRRLRSEGHVPFMVKTMLIAWQAHRRGSFSNVDIEYKMGEWDQDEKEKQSLLDKIKRTMFFRG